jgi:hypothetical protein
LRRVLGAALMSWFATAGVGATLVATWLERGGLRGGGRRRLSGPLLLAHVLPAVVGLMIFVVYAFTDVEALAWSSCAILALVAGWGAHNFVLWQQRRLGSLRATSASWNVPPSISADPHLPPEQHFPVAVVVLHGVLGVTTFALTLLTAAGA